jgi:hypothetical protein
MRPVMYMVRIEQIRYCTETGNSRFTIKMFNKFDKLCEFIEKYMLRNCTTPCETSEPRMLIYKDRDDGELWVYRSSEGIKNNKYRNIGDNATYMNTIKTDIINEMITKNETGTFSVNDYHLLHSWEFLEEHHDTVFLFEIFKIIQSDE